MDARAEIEAMFAPGVGPDEAITEHLPRVHAAQLDEYARVVSVPLLASLLLADTGRRYTFELSEQGAEVERGEGIDFPAATIIARAGEWDRVRPLLRELSLAMDESREALRRRAKKRLGAEAAKAWERLRGTIGLTVGDGAERVGAFELALNEYEIDQSAPRIEVAIDAVTLMGLARGALDPSDLKEHVELAGSIGLGVSLAGFFAKYLL